MPGVDQQLSNELKEELARVLAGLGAIRQVASPPRTAMNQVADLVTASDGSGGVDLAWTYRSVGDYDQNGEVNISDLTQIGIHFGKTTASPDWDAAHLADGDENGEVNISDVTPLGLNFGNQAAGYKVFSSFDEADYPDEPDGPNGAGTSEAGQVVLAAASPGPGGLLGFGFNASPHPPGTKYWVRPFDSQGVLGAASNMVSDTSWAHTWGANTNESLYGMAYAEEGSIFTAGNFYNNVDNDLLVLKYDLAGNLLWARKWAGSGDDFALSVATGSNGEVFVAGQTNSSGAGGDDMLLQRWDTDGNLIWSKTWGGASFDGAIGVAVVQDAVYLTGNSASFGDTQGDILLVKLNLDGDEQWARRLGGGEAEHAYGMIARRNPVTQKTNIHITGSSASYSDIGLGLLYAKINEDGEAVTVSIWEGSASSPFGTSISVSGGLTDQVYICGKDNGDVTRVLLLEYSSLNDGISKSWVKGDTQRAYDLLLVDSKLIAGISFYEGSSYSGCLLGLNLDGTLYSVDFLSNNQNYLNDLAYIPGLGIAGCGFAVNAAGGTWVPTSGSLTDVAGNWTIYADSTAPVIGTMMPQSLAAEEYGGIIVDTGGGSSDAFAFVREVP